jgi:hypothetical protein
MTCQRIPRIVVCCLGLAFASPAAFAVNDDHLSGPEAAPAQGSDQQAHDLAVWQGLRADLGLTDGEVRIAQNPQTTAQLAPTVTQTPTGPATPAPAKQGSDVDVLSEVKEFYRGLIKQPNGLPPGVVADFKPDPAPAAEVCSDPELPSDSENATLILGPALRYQGALRWGSANWRVDCSGLIIRAAADGGKPGLPHSAAELWKIGTRVDKSEMKPGDLVFFKNTYKRGISHVGIFAGGRKFLHASSGKKKVTTGNLNDRYFQALGDKTLGLPGEEAAGREEDEEIAHRARQTKGTARAVPFRSGPHFQSSGTNGIGVTLSLASLFPRRTRTMKV